MIAHFKKWPFGIIAGASFIIFFYSTLAFVAFYLVFSGVANQTGEVVSPFASWWQVLLFILAIISFICMVASFVFFVLKKMKYKEEANEKEDA